jgi:tripartite-type tricarboxylate transporter receptor subunit TctC
MTFSHWIKLGACAIALLTATAASAQKYPSKPVRIIVPYAPGGATDTAARIIAEPLRQILGETFLVENKTGASGIIAIEEMARSKPDGYTLMVGNVSTNALTPILLGNRLRINYERDVTIVARIADVPSLLLSTTVNFPPKTLPEFIAYAKERPGQLRFSSAGLGSIQQIDMAVMASRTGINLVHIPTKDGAASITRDITKGDTHVTFGNVSSSLPRIKAGLGRALAIIGPDRVSVAPDVPTFAEHGYPDVGSVQWQAMFAPAGTPREVQEKLFSAVVEGLKSPALLDSFEKVGGALVPPQKSLDETQAWLRNELARYRKIIEEHKIVAEE